MKHDLNNKNFERKAKRVYSVFACVALLLVSHRSACAGGR